MMFRLPNAATALYFTAKLELFFFFTHLAADYLANTCSPAIFSR